MLINQMRVNHLHSPVGYRMEGPVRFSWAVENAEGKKQKAVQLTMAKDEAFTEIVFDSGQDENHRGTVYEAVMDAKPFTRYFWKVKVWDDAGNAGESPVAFFETGKDETWRGEWITADLDKDAQPLLRKCFTVSGAIRQARAYVAALGIFELEVNGEKAGDEYLLPGFHSYDNWLQYYTFDISGKITEGENVIGARLGDGWWKSRLMFPEKYGGVLALRCEVWIEYADGRVDFTGTDETWQSHESETLSSSIYDGEVIVMALAAENWSKAGIDTSGWKGVKIIQPAGTGEITARLSPPIRIVEERKPCLIKTPKNEWVLDFGQIMTGWVQFNTAGLPNRTKIFLQYGEILQDGCFFNENNRSAKAEFTYISDGKARTARPHFTFYGFRYVKVEGWVGEINPESFTGCVIMSDLERSGQIKTANPLINKLVENIVWGQKGNFLDVPTDCPQRDERFGWTGDAQVFCGTGCFNLYAASFYHKYLVDMRYEQLHFDGSIPYVVPTPKRKGMTEFGSAAWADAATVVPWEIYLHYGDREMLAQHYPLMKDFVDWMIRRDQADGDKKLCQVGYHFADWLALDNFLDKNTAHGETDMHYIASAFYAHSTQLAAKAAGALGKKEDEAYYNNRAAEIRQAFAKEYFTEAGRCAIDTQTAYVVALFLDLLPEGFTERNLNALLRRLKRRDMHLETGFVGTPYLCRLLTARGHADKAYTLLFNDDYPSWLYEVKMGATTVWERWNSVLPDGKLSGIGMNSLNHYAYGSIGEWLYRDVCGLNPLEEAPGFKKVLIAPKPDPRLPWIELNQKTIAGEYEIKWRYEKNGDWVLDIKIPFDCEAEVRIPEGFRAKNAKGKKLLLDAGKYTFHCKPAVK